MTTLPRPPVFKTPKYKVRIHSTVFNRLTMAATYLDTSHNTKDVGWLEFPTGLKQVFSSDHIDRFKCTEMIDGTKMSFYIYEQDIDIFRYDAVLRTRDVSFVSGVDADNQIDNTDGSYILVTIDSNGYTSPDTTGSVVIQGTDPSDASISEPLTINGDGTYITDKLFKTIDSSGISCTGLSNCAVTLWGDIGLPFRRREMRIYTDTNDDGIYGLVFGGFTIVNTQRIPYDDKLYKITGVGYDDFQKNNEYIAGFRSMSRCSNYSSSGIAGDCLVDSVNWQANGKCFVGDYNTYHPNGTVQCDPEYRCTDFVETSDYLPYDGYTYDEGYEDSSGNYYSPYPPDYFRCGLAIEKMCRSYEHETKFSNPTTLFMVARAKLGEDVNDEETFIDIDVSSKEGYFGDITGTAIYAVLEDDNYGREALYVSGGYGNTLGVTTRGALKTEAREFSTGDNVYFYESAIVSKNMVSEDDMLIEGNINSTIWATMESIAETMTERIVNSYWVMWVDKFRQIHIDEMYGENVGHSDNFTIAEQDIARVVKVSVSGVTNSVSATVTVADGTRFYPTLNVEDTDIDPSGNSVLRYGRNWEELSNKQLNAIGESNLSEGMIGFRTYAYNYLKTHAFPKHTQTIEILAPFVPDEHYEENGTEPALAYTDAINEHIDLRTKRVDCPDFNLQGNPVKEFVIEGIKYDAREYNTMTVSLIMSRIADD